MNTKSKKLLVALVSLIALAAAGLGYWQLTKDDQKTPAASNSLSAEQEKALAETPIEISYLGEDGKSALDILKAKHQVEATNSAGIGDFVNSINGIKPDDKHFWAFYVNGQQAQVGAGSYITKTDEVITWKLEEIK